LHDSPAALFLTISGHEGIQTVKKIWDVNPTWFAVFGFFRFCPVLAFRGYMVGWVCTSSIQRRNDGLGRSVVGALLVRATRKSSHDLPIFAINKE
jgi:hypothetical protein